MNHFPHLQFKKYILNARSFLKIGCSTSCSMPTNEKILLLSHSLGPVSHARDIYIFLKTISKLYHHNCAVIELLPKL